jgi:muramoyltetrapeptide carboxypeptidase
LPPSAPPFRPRALRPGDLVGVCAPSGAVGREAALRGVAALRALGFEVRFSESMFDRRFFTAGPAEGRLQELHALFADDAVAGIVCARGGAGAAALLAGLDPALIRAHPKVFVGYSDVTFLHLFLHRLGLVTVHGPMVARDLADGSYDALSLRSAISGEGPLFAAQGAPLRPLRPGVAEGRLRGGCLSILAAAAGTPWSLVPDDEGTILFLEDIDERPYRIDRMLFQLRASGGFEGVKGVVFGEMKGCAAFQSDGYSLEEVLLEALTGLDVPIAIGMPSGHTAGTGVSLPLGVRAHLRCDGNEARFEVLEAAVQ